MKETSTALLLIAVALALVVVPSALADDVITSASITNVAPTVTSLACTDPVTLVENTGATVTCTATITDNNGYEDVQTEGGVAATFWDPATTTEGAGDNSTDHYTDATCDFSGGSGTTVTATCEFSLTYYANPAEWTAKFTATDGASVTGTQTITDVTVSATVALSVPTPLAYGEIVLGAQAGEETVTVTNTGNTAIDIQLSGEDSAADNTNSFDCTVGTIPIGLEKYSFTSGTYASKTNLTGSAVEEQLDLAKRTGAVSTAATYWDVAAPGTGVGGTCAGKIVFVAVAD